MHCISCFSLVLRAASPLSSLHLVGVQRNYFFQFLHSSSTQRLERLLDCFSAMKTWVLLLPVCCLGGGGKKEKGRYLHAPLVCYGPVSLHCATGVLEKVMYLSQEDLTW